MYQANIELLKISTLRIKYSLVLLDNTGGKKDSFPPVSKFTIGNNQYLKVLLRGRVVFEYVKGQGEVWEATNQIGFTKVYFYQFLRRLKRFVGNFTIPDIFGYGPNKRLIINKEISDQNKLYMQTTNRACTLEYSVVQDVNNQEVEYEGCIMKINKEMNAILLTYDEICTICDIMDRIDFDVLGMQAIMLAKMHEETPSKAFGQTAISAPIEQEPTVFRAPSVIERPNLFP